MGIYSGMSPRLDGYVRVSRVGARAGEGYISPNVQRDAITAGSGGPVTGLFDDRRFST
jgi:hypothetical protein